MTVLIGILSPPRLEFWPSRCNLGLHIVTGVGRLHLKKDYLAVKRVPNLDPRHIYLIL
jgi:hypothetical protein